MTVQNLINKAVRLIDDYDNITDYNTTCFEQVSIIIGELIRLGIGVNPIEFNTETPDTAPYTPTDTDFTPVALPADLTVDDQVMSVTLDDIYSIKTETHSGALYLLVPVDYSGEISVVYSIQAPTFAALSTVLPISDEAVNVAAYGLAELLAYSNAAALVDVMAGKYEKAKREWRRRNYHPKRIRDVYNF